MKNRTKLLLLAVAAMLLSGSSRADGLTTTVLSETIGFAHENSLPNGSFVFTEWIFLTGFPVQDTISLFGANNGGNLAPAFFTVVAVSNNTPGVFDYFGSYSVPLLPTCSQVAANLNLNQQQQDQFGFSCGTEFATLTLFDVNGLVSGLPFQCTTCVNTVSQHPGFDEFGSNEIFAALNSSLGPPPTPTPEPASLLMFGSGLAIASWRIRRKARKSSVVSTKGV